MTDCPTSIPLYETLLRSIGDYYDAQEATVNQTVELNSFANKILHEESVIAEFEQVTKQFAQHLDNYDFQTGFRYDEFDRIIESLLNLQPKMKEMGEEAKKLEPYPDRCGSRKAIATCNNLVLKIKENLGLDEIDKATALVEANTKKLISIRQQIDQEEHKELKKILSALKNRNPDMWRDVAEDLEERVTAFMKSGKKCISSEIECFKKEIEKESENKKRDVQIMLNKYPWLQKKRFAGYHSSLITERHLTFSEYLDSIQKTSKERKTAICMGVFIIVIVVSVALGGLFSL